MERHSKAKISTYQEYRDYMKESTQGEKEFLDAHNQYMEYQDRVLKNADAVERMGALGIFETSKRVRESIAWNKSKRYAEIQGERIEPKEIVAGGYGQQYATPVDTKYSQLLQDDLVGFRNKFLQFMASPDV
jgi:hypothetical protein